MNASDDLSAASQLSSLQTPRWWTPPGAVYDGVQAPILRCYLFHQNNRMTCNFGKLPLTHISGIIFAVGIFGVLFTTLPSHAQEFGRIEETESNVAYFYFAEKGEATIQVLVWGTVSRPGIYEIGTDTQIDRLLTMAGGAPIPIEQEGRDPAEITIRLFRPDDDGNETKVFEATLEEMLNRNTEYPALNDDDILVVKTFQPGSNFGWRDALSLVSSLGTLTLIGLRLFGRRR